jgi:hypothetical protein
VIATNSYRKLALLLPILCLFPNSRPLAAEPKSHVELSILLQDSTILENQTIYMIIQLRNTGTEVIEDVAPLDLFVRLELYEEGSRTPLKPQRSAQRQVISSGPGPRLRPGEARCEVRDLLTYYGRSPDTSAGLKWWEYLPPGKYELRASMSLHTGGHGAKQETVEARAVRFEIRALASDPDQEALVRAYVEEAKSVSRNQDERASAYRALLAKFYESPFLIQVYLDAGPAMSAIGIEPILTEMRRRGVSASRRAALTGVRCLIDPRVSERQPEWYAQMLDQATSDLERCVIHSWQEKRSHSRK